MHLLADGLRDKQPVKWIMMKKRQSTCGHRMSIGYLKIVKTRILEPVHNHLGIVFKLPDPPLDGNLPDTRRGDIDRLRSPYQRDGPSAKPWATCHEPEQNIRVEQ
jgi:hypothetical protein